MNAPESAQIGRPNLKATRRNVDALSKVRQNWYVYFRDGAFTFARYDVFHAAASATKDLSRAFTPWSHVVALIYQQLTKTESLNGVCDAARLHAFKKRHSSLRSGN